MSELPPLSNFQVGLVDQDTDAIQETINKLNELLEAAINAKSVQDKLSLPCQLALVMHKKMCRNNHTDGCGWYYEVSQGNHNWSGNEHKLWKDKAKTLLKELEGMLDRPVAMEDAKRAIKAVNG